MIGIVNYGLGNIHAFANIYKRLNISVKIASTPDELCSAARIILPGVGAFDWAMTRLNESGLKDSLQEMVVGESKSVLRICVGMQMMANRSDEDQLDGLGWIAGEVKRFDDSAFTQKTHLPHMGWNDVTPQGNNNLFKNLESKA